MAFTSSAVWEVETGGNDANGGGFDTGVAGFPTDGTTDVNTGNTASPVFSSASYSFVAGDVGAWIYIKSGANSLPGWYKIASVAGGKATLSAAIGAGVLAAGTPTTAAGIATVGTPTVLTWGVDYSQQTSALIAFTDMVIGGTTTQFTSALNPVGKNFVGNVINITSGTGFTVQRVAVVSTSGTTATCDKSLGTGASTGGNGTLGGAFASPALPFSVAIASNSVWVQGGSYTISSGSSNVTGGVIANNVSGVRLEAYGSVRGDLGTPATLTASGISTVTMLSGTSFAMAVRNFIVDGAGLTAIRGFALGSQAQGYLLTAKNCTNNGFAVVSAITVLIRCSATGCSTQPAFLGCLCFLCEAYSNTVTGFSLTSGAGAAIACLSFNNSGASSDGFAASGSGSLITGCVAYNNGRDGFHQSGVGVNIVNSIAESNAGTGFNVATATCAVLSCAAYSNGVNYALTGAFLIAQNNLTPTVDVFVNAAAGNFALNANAGGGALLRAAGIPGATPDGLSQGYLDIGALQSQAQGGLGLGADFQGGFAA